MESDQLLRCEEEVGESEGLSDTIVVNKIFGTTEESLIWFNTTDSTGLICSFLVIMSIAFTMTSAVLFYLDSNLGVRDFSLIIFLTSMSFICHLKTMMTDPGAVPRTAHPISPMFDIPIESSTLSRSSDNGLPTCGRCDGYKPPGSHHDRVSNRCVSRMDHFCPWMNNAIGIKNQKNFILFLIYTDLASIYFYVTLVIHLIACDAIDCSAFAGSNLVIARVLVFVLLFGMVFTTSMIASQLYGLCTGRGTIDRLKSKDFDHMSSTSSKPVPFAHVFGMRWISFVCPLAPTFADEDAVFKYKILSKKYSSDV